ncbi:MAG: hypothetical protein KTR14_01980 [Vampirovibrio sp.]|nr:hypothetical protein [Vampirovibrio sp.]
MNLALQAAAGRNGAGSNPFQNAKMPMPQQTMAMAGFGMTDHLRNQQVKNYNGLHANSLELPEEIRFGYQMYQGLGNMLMTVA